MKYICNKAGSTHCKRSHILNKCSHAIPHDVFEYDEGDNCMKIDECFIRDKSIKVKCIKNYKYYLELIK